MVTIRHYDRNNLNDRDQILYKSCVDTFLMDKIYILSQYIKIVCYEEELRGFKDF